jgi:hypothetical protein
MANLDYQNRDQAIGENRSRVRRSLFGPSRADVWARLAEEIGGTFSRGGWCNSRDRVDVTVGPWQVTLNLHTESTGESSMSYTQLRAPYVNADGFRFRVYRASIFAPIGKLFGMQDVEIGDSEFDEAFVIKGNNEFKLSQLFANPRLRELLPAEKSVNFEVCDDEGWFKQRFPEGVDELRFRALGVIKDIDHLKRLFDLFAETLNTLCHIGSAYEDDPGIRLS